jgi:pimeloyl-ACP methyl ester carboxylesterase
MANPATPPRPYFNQPISEPPTRPSMLFYYARRLIVQPLTVDIALRLLGAKALPGAAQQHFIAQGLNVNDVRRAIARARSVNNWVEGWRMVAAEREAEGYKLMEQGYTVSASQFFFYAALAYHFAQFIYFDDLDEKQDIHHHSVECYKLAGRMFEPPAERVEIPFRGITMSGYLRVPRGVTKPPVVINVNGAAMGKEQFYIWENEFLARGMATLSFDGPGSGETWAKMPMALDYEKVGTALLDWLATRADVDGDHVGLNGVSLGGYLTMLIAAAGDPRIRVISMDCSPYNIARDYRVVMPLVRREIRYLFGFNNRTLHTVLRVKKRDLATNIKIPALVVSGGHDVIVPPRCSKQIYAHLAGKKQLLFYPRAGHICYEGFPDLMMKIADWFATYIH